MTGRTTADAALITAPGTKTFEITTVDVDQPVASEVLVDVKATGLCHSDWNMVAVDYGIPHPALLGHESVGVVAAVGPDVDDIEVGDHVVSFLVPSCGACEMCRGGKQVHCLRVDRARRSPDAPPRYTHGGVPVFQFAGVGGFCSRGLWDRSQVAVIDRGIPFDRAALLGCAVATGAGAVLRSAHLRPTESVVVIGAGGVGLNAVQAAAFAGASKIIVVDAQPEKAELAARFGATSFVDALAQDPVDEVLRLTAGRGVDHVFEMTGIEQPLHDGLRMLGPRGTLYIVGQQKPGTVLSFPADLGVSAELRVEPAVRAVRMGSTDLRVDLPYYADLYLQGRLNLDDLVSRTITLDQIDEAYASLISTPGLARQVLTFD